MMGWLKRSVEDGVVERRIARMGPAEKSQWAEQCLYSIGQALHRHGTTGSQDWLNEARMGANTLKRILDSM